MRRGAGVWLWLMMLELPLACGGDGEDRARATAGNGGHANDSGASAGADGGDSGTRAADGGKGGMTITADRGAGAGGGGGSGGARAGAGGAHVAGGRGGDASPAAVSGGAGAAGADTGDIVSYGEARTGGEFHLGPVDWDETQWHNACAPGTKYSPLIRELEGELLVGLWNGIADTAAYCDACIHVVTERGKSAVLRVVTYGDTSANSIDVSPDAYQLLNSGEYPRAMTWQFAKCPDTGNIVYEFQSAASEDWTSLWVRNARVPITKVEVKSQRHDFRALERGTDGTLTDGGGFGKGAFTIRLSGTDGQQVVHDFSWPASGLGSAVLTGSSNFH